MIYFNLGCDNFEKGVDIFNSETENTGDHFCKACECPADTFPGTLLICCYFQQAKSQGKSNAHKRIASFGFHSKFKTFLINASPEELPLTPKYFQNFPTQLCQKQKATNFIVKIALYTGAKS